jgi:hypothetical protein
VQVIPPCRLNAPGASITPRRFDGTALIARAQGSSINGSIMPISKLIPNVIVPESVYGIPLRVPALASFVGDPRRYTEGFLGDRWSRALASLETSEIMLIHERLNPKTSYLIA